MFVYFYNITQETRSPTQDILKTQDVCMHVYLYACMYDIVCMIYLYVCMYILKPRCCTTHWVKVVQHTGCLRLFWMPADITIHIYIYIYIYVYVYIYIYTK
jgi:hypothetical protein